MLSQGALAWFEDAAKDGWVLGRLDASVVSGQNVQLRFKRLPTFPTAADEPTDEQEYIVETSVDKLQSQEGLPPLKNPPILEGVDDLSNLTYLHEPAVLHNIRLRYQREQIYTYSGIVLIAVNPFQRLNIYSSSVMREYIGKRREDLEPHLFAVAEEAFRRMINNQKNQSIIISGESGAGKTQSAKIIMRYFANVNNLEANQGESDISEIESAVLSTNPILESFGNSKTSRNDNSSRFGKYIEILFSKHSKITGARIRTYLLERSRLVFQPANERNYHIFYQLCAGVPNAERKELELGKWQEYKYLNQGDVNGIDGVDEISDFSNTQQSFSKIGISVTTQWDVFRLCAALLHIGNIEIIENSDVAAVDMNSPSINTVSRLLKINKDDFSNWIVKKCITTRSEKIISNRTKSQAVAGLDAVSKFLYSQLFSWIISTVNKNLESYSVDSSVQNFIGVLDIYGFEHFKKNSFEQFCINYANEKLQQEFNQHVFKLEQEEYVREGIDWSFIAFNDNQPCIDIIEGKLGIIDLLDEESRLPMGNDSALIHKLYQRFDGMKSFAKPRFNSKSFIVKHYAIDVMYEIEGFIEKNKELVSEEHLHVLSNSSFDFLKEILCVQQNNGLITPGGHAKPPHTTSNQLLASKKPTFGTIFKSSLVDLMTTLRSTDMHYIRCIKPNDSKSPFKFEPLKVLTQLRACGILETIRISCTGYPSRWTFKEFTERYFFLISSHYWGTDTFIEVKAKRILESVFMDDGRYHIGLTKVFLRMGQLAELEKARAKRLHYVVTLIQKHVKGRICRLRYISMKRSAIIIQREWRRFIARQIEIYHLQTQSAIKIQTWFRARVAIRRYTHLRQSAIKIQSTFRMYIERQRYIHLIHIRAATRIQKIYRGHVTRKMYRRVVYLITLIQSCLRRRMAKKRVKSLKIEARSLGGLRDLNYRLEKKVILLSQGMKSRDDEIKSQAMKIAALESQLQSWKDKFFRLEASSKATIVSLQTEINERKERSLFGGDGNVSGRRSRAGSFYQGKTVHVERQSSVVSETNNTKAVGAGVSLKKEKEEIAKSAAKLDGNIVPSICALSIILLYHFVVRINSSNIVS